MRILLLMLIGIAYSSQLLAQQLAGSVSDEKGLPLSKALVKIVPQQKTLLTDEKGQFSILVKPGKVQINVSFIGYQSLDTVLMLPLAQALQIKLKPFAHQLEEVTVNTGYQQIVKERSTGSFSKVDQVQLNQSVKADLLGRLEGITSALLVDKRAADGTTYQIRGLGSLSVSSMMPLIVLDNFPYEGDINNINPNDIENVTVLKDAAASAIWGASAGNGVIVITTKQARSGSKPVLNLNTSLNIQARPDIFTANQLNSVQTIDLERFLFDKGYFDNRFTDSYFPIIPEAVEILQAQKSGMLSDFVSEQQLSVLRRRDVRSDLLAYLYQPAISQQYALDIAASNGITGYRISGGADIMQANLKGNSSNRYTLRADNTLKITERLKLQLAVGVTKTGAANNSPGGYGSFSPSTGGISVYSRLANDNGDALPLNLFYRGIFTDTVGNGKLLSWKYKPIEELINSDRKSASLDLLLSAGANYKFNSWLSADVKYQYQTSNRTEPQYFSEATYFTRDLINRFTQPGVNTIYKVPRGGIFKNNFEGRDSYASRAQINLQKHWGIHELSGIVGVEKRQIAKHTDYLMLYGYDPETIGNTAVDFANQYPTYLGMMGNSYIDGAGRPRETLNRFFSVFANAAYSFEEKYTVTGSIRRDASNLFGVSTNQKWVPLWSIGGLWRIDREPFFNHVLFSALSLRLSYGLSGNVNQGVSALTLITYSQAATSPINLASVAVSAPANPYLRWEQTEQLNIGVDFGLLRQRFTGSVDVFSKYAFDLINGINLDPTTGFSTVNLNSAAIRAKGVDVVVNSKNIDGVFGWQTSLLFNYVNYNVVASNTTVVTTGLTADGTIVFPLPGYNPYEIVSYRWAGLDPITGNPRGYLNGNVSTDYNALSLNPLTEQVIHGPAVPPVFGNIQNTLTWKQLSLALNIRYKFGYYFRRPSLNYTSMFQTSRGFSEYGNRWQKPGDELLTNVPSLIYPANALRDNFYNQADINVEKGDHIRLEDLYLSYKWQPKTSRCLKQVTVYSYINQLNFIFWRANQLRLDPDLIYGIKNRTSFALGIKATL